MNGLARNSACVEKQAHERVISRNIKSTWEDFANKHDLVHIITNREKKNISY